MNDRTIHNARRIGLAALCALNLALGANHATAGNSSVVLKSKANVPSSELKWWKSQSGILVNNIDAQLLLDYLNHDSKWQIGPLQPRGFNFVRDQASLEKILAKGVDGNAAFGVATKIDVFQDGRSRGSRSLTPYVFACLPSRNAKGYSAILVSGRDLNTGYWWTRAIVLEGEDGNRLNIHEYAIWGGSVTRTSYKKGETFLLQAITTAAGKTKTAFERETMPRMQRSRDMFQQAKEFLINDPNSSVNVNCASSSQLATSKQEPWWKKILNQALHELWKALQDYGKKLLDDLWEYVKNNFGPLRQLGDWFSSLLGGIRDWFKGLF